MWKFEEKLMTEKLVWTVTFENSENTGKRLNTLSIGEFVDAG